MADARDLKSRVRKGRAGSIPASATELRRIQTGRLVLHALVFPPSVCE
jgi:hypothetical protein